MHNQSIGSESSSSEQASGRRQWWTILFFVALSFICVFLAAQGALVGESERLIDTNMLSDSLVSYHYNPDTQSNFAPMNLNVILEATSDAAGLKITYVAPKITSNPLDEIKTPQSLISDPTNTPTIKPPSNNEPPKATRVPGMKTSHPRTPTKIPNDTPLPRTPTFTPTNTPYPNTLTFTPTSTPSSPPTATFSVTPSLDPSATDVPVQPTQAPKPTQKPKPTRKPKPTKKPKKNGDALLPLQLLASNSISETNYQS
jgi:hypothetical protein